MTMSEQVADELYGLHCDIGRLEAENAKLRELVKDIDEVADPFLWEFIGRRMRELGVEVEENDVSAGLRVEDARRTQ